MAYALVNKEKYLRAKAVAGDDDQKLLEEYQRIGGKTIESTNEVIEVTRKMVGIYDKGRKSSKKKIMAKGKKANKPAKKGKKGKK
ncbi:unnamed protein product [marine sediment metagenome]|uniref:Uncharacterized protein n=1 Tax=marine sediment metagenome TaxID=412755 RepID=X0UU33_9ZZZZ